MGVCPNNIKLLYPKSNVVLFSNWDKLTPHGIERFDYDPREYDAITGEYLTRDEINARRLHELHLQYPEAVFICHEGAWHAAITDKPAGRDMDDPSSNSDLRPLGRRLLDRLPNSVLSMNFFYSNNLSVYEDTIDPALYDASFTLPISKGPDVADSWLAEGWLVR